MFPLSLNFYRNVTPDVTPRELWLSEIKLCDPWITSGLHPFGFLTNLSKHDMFGRESGEMFISQRFEEMTRDDRSDNDHK